MGRAAMIEISPTERFGTARRPEREVARERPAGMSDELVSALGTVSEALEVVEDARGHLYAFHRLCGTADLTLQRAVTELRGAGRPDIADEIDQVLVGRDVIAGRWSFQVVEDYDESYYRVFRAMQSWARSTAGDVPPHLFEAEMQLREQRDGT
jgi:hypothetical protein